MNHSTIIDNILLHCDVRLAIELGNEDIKRRRLHILDLPLRWETENEHILLWLQKYNVPGHTAQTMNKAEESGNLLFLKWLHQRGQQCTTDAMDCAVCALEI